MNDIDLISQTKSFEAVMLLSERLCPRPNPLATVMCTFFAMWCAFKIRSCLGDEGIENNTGQPTDSIDELVSGIRPLPSADSVRSASESLLASRRLSDQSGIQSALDQMGVLRLCPDLSSHFMAMRQVAGYMTSRTRVIPLVELAHFAAEVQDYDHASSYATEARALDPVEWELYSIYTVEGLIAFSRGNYSESARLLGESVTPCLCNEYVSLECGIRALNVSLLERLLSVGFRDEVLEHLSHCRDVWQSLRPQIDVWISLLNSGEMPDFRASKTIGLMNTPSFRLKMQWSKAAFLEDETSSGADKFRIQRSRAEVLAGRKRLRAEYGSRRDIPPDGGTNSGGR